MKKFLVLLFLLMSCSICYATVTPISTDSFVTPDDVSIGHLEDFRVTVIDAINDFNGGRIQSDTITPDALNNNADPTVRWGEAFGDWVYTGLIPPTDASLTSTTTSGTAYVKDSGDKMNRVEKDATQYTYTASKYTYVDLKHDGTYTYIEADFADPEPGVTVESIRLCRVSTDGSAVVNVRDDRIMSISLDSHQEDFYRVGLRMSIHTPDTISIDSGVVYNGSYRIQKVTPTSLNIGTAGDWVSGGSERSANTYAFVVAGPETNTGIKMTTTVPTLHDRGGNKGGINRYSLIGSAYWRVIAWFRMDTAQNLNYHDWGNFPDGQNIDNHTFVSGDTEVTTSSTTFVDLDSMQTYFYNCTSGDVKVVFNAPFFQALSDQDMFIGINIDGKVQVPKRMHLQDDAGHTSCMDQTLQWVQDLPSGGHDIKMQWKASTANPIYQDGNIDASIEGEGPRTMYVEEMI